MIACPPTRTWRTTHSWPDNPQPRPISPKTSRFWAYVEKVHTFDTRARLWDIDGLHGKGDEILDDKDLRKRLADLGSFWRKPGMGAEREKPGVSTRPKFVLITVGGDPSCNKNSMRICPDTLQWVMNIAGVDAKSSEKFLRTTLPVNYTQLHYSDDRDVPTSITLFFRCPKMSNCLLGVLKIDFSTLDCFAFMASYLDDDMQDIQSRCVASISALHEHPLALLPIVLEHRFLRWTHWFAGLWRDIVEMETSNEMTHPRWRAHEMGEERRRYLADADNMLRQLHATNIELCHSHTVMASALRLADFCLEALQKVDDGRARLGLPTMGATERVRLEEDVEGTVVRLRAMGDRLDELTARLSGQINVSYNLIAQKDSKTNFAIAKLQAHDSRTVKAIAVLTLLFLPTTLLATLWTTNLFEFKGDKNWHAFLISSLLLTLVVFVCWSVYGYVSRKRDEARWPLAAASNSLSFAGGA